jgi:hypothetical protein
VKLGQASGCYLRGVFDAEALLDSQVRIEPEVPGSPIWGSEYVLLQLWKVLRASS